MLYTLSYVNLPDDRIIDKERYFMDLHELERWVINHHPDFTSYQVIAVKQHPR